MEFNEKEIEQIKDALEHLHNADLSNYDTENIYTLEKING